MPCKKNRQQLEGRQLAGQLTCKSGLNPPWQQKIFSSMIAAMGRQLKQSVKVFHSFTL
jgi:hypothetical protein